MRIIKYQKIKNNIYLLTLEDNSKIELYEEVILKYELLIKNEINKNLKDILNDNRFYDCYYSAIKYLNYRRRSTKEIKQKLKSIGYADQYIESTIEKLKKQKYLDDYEYAKCFIKEKITLTNHGPNKIKNDLRQKGIAEEIIDKTIDEYDYDVQKEKINKIIDKMIKANHDKGSIYLKRKIYNDLCYEGFNKEIIDEVVSSKTFKDDEILREKEEQKLRKKYENKYNGIELEYKIKEALRKKGLLYYE